jgi:asparagine synthase (glutamine-hydrolysing)
MCGIWGLVGKPLSAETLELLLALLKPRGPERTYSITESNYQLGFTRLALNGLSDTGMQPMEYGTTRWICNGEIYNWKTLAEEIGFVNTSGSDCEIIGPYFKSRSNISDFFNRLHGVFSMIIVSRDRIIVGRDPYGVRPLFMSIGGSKIIFSSELKAVPNGYANPFPPGHYAIINKHSLRVEMVKYHFLNISPVPRDDVFSQIRHALTKAVQIRMMTERPVAALLSGGLDSSLIAALVQKELLKTNRCLETFSIGFEGSEDLRHARMVANHIGSKHTEVCMTPEEFFEAIPQVIHDIESYDITTVRASVGNWLVAREISRQSECKVVFNGDGSDEVFGGYLYFYRAPSDEAFEYESDRLLKDIHLFDVLRSDRCISSHGLEARTPFLDKEFVSVVKSIPVDMRRPTPTQIEKWVLRKAFDGDLLPYEVLYRKKEAFSDGVSTNKGISWYQECQSRALEKVPNWNEKFMIHLNPKTAEAYYYRNLFDTFYPQKEYIIPYYWMPKWSPETSDPSARTLHPTTVDSSKKDIRSIEELLHFSNRH